MEQIYDYTIQLIRYVLNGDIPELPENIDFEKLFDFGKSHGVENMLYVGLRDLRIDIPSETMKKFQTAYEMQIMVEATQALELEAIGEAFEEAGIDYVPLKGSVIKYLYPMPDYRKSGDIDILIHPEDENKIDNLMSSVGYHREKEMDGLEVHFSYVKSPFLEVEIHRVLTTESDRAFGFCNKVWNYVDQQTGHDHLYHLKDEYMYVYLMAHLCKHLYFGGAGIRLITDFYVMQKKCKLDDKLVERYMKKANLTDLNAMISALVSKWFRNEYRSDFNADVLEKVVFTSGSFGTAEMREAICNSDTNTDNTIWFIKRIFPPRSILKYRYPIVKKKPYLILFIWIYRLIDMLIIDRKATVKKLNNKFSSNNKIMEIQGIVKAVRPIK